MTKLYELTNQINELRALDLDEETLRDTLEGIEGAMEVKAENLLSVVANMDADIDAIDNEIKRLQGRKKVMTNRKEHLKDYLRDNMERAEISKIECPLFTISLVKGRQVVAIDDVESIPEEFVTTEVTYKPAKAQILAALKDGADIPGAHISTGKSSIRIK